MSKLNLIVSRLPHMRFQLYMAPVRFTGSPTLASTPCSWNHMPR